MTQKDIAIRRKRGAQLALVAAALWASAAFAHPKSGDGPRDHRAGPPPQAMAACESLNSGDSCSFTGKHGQASGSCWAPNDKPLACRPTNAPPPRER